MGMLGRIGSTDGMRREGNGGGKTGGFQLQHGTLEKQEEGSITWVEPEKVHFQNCRV
jgi:hypothetical protein